MLIRPLTTQMFNAIMLDDWPGLAARADFGLMGPETQKHYEALYYPVRKGEITLETLNEALGNGPALTALVNGCESNPHKGIVFKTPYDNLGEEDDS